MLTFFLVLALTLFHSTPVHLIGAGAGVALAVASMTSPITIIRRRTVCQRTGLSDTTIWRLVKADSFPRPIQLSKQAVGWREDEVEAWIRQRAQVRDEGRPSPNPRARRPTSAPTAHTD